MQETGKTPFLEDDPQRRDLQAQIDSLRGIIDQVRRVLRDAQDQPATHLREQAAALSDSFAKASQLALVGFERSESRLIELEQKLQTRMSQLSRDIETMIAEVRSARPAAPLPPAATPAAFSLESVMRIHEEERATDSAPGTAPTALRDGLAAFGPDVEGREPKPRRLPETTATALAARMETLERAVEKTATPPTARLSPVMIGALALVAAIAVLSLWMQRRVSVTLGQAQQRVAAVEQQSGAAADAANAKLAATREDAARQVAEAQQSASQARIVGSVLAAPDLVRYWLVGASPTSRAYAQMLFSRSRGMVFSAARLPAPGAGKTYQVWLLTKGGPVSAGLAVPDSAGRLTISTDVPLAVPKRITGTSVTIEPAGGKSQPTGSAVLVRAR